MNPLYALELEELDNTEEVKQRFRITDLDSLNWVLRKLAALKAKEDEILNVYEAEIRRIKAWAQKETESIERSRQFFNSLIEEYAKEQRAKDPKWKASTPYGKVSFRKQPPKWEYDEEKAIASLRENGLFDYIRVKHELDKATLKKGLVVTSDGRVVDPVSGAVIEGVVVIEQPESMKVEVSE